MASLITVRIPVHAYDPRVAPMIGAELWGFSLTAQGPADRNPRTASQQPAAL